MKNAGETSDYDYFSGFEFPSEEEMFYLKRRLLWMDKQANEHLLADNWNISLHQHGVFEMSSNKMQLVVITVFSGNPEGASPICIWFVTVCLIFCRRLQPMFELLNGSWRKLGLSYTWTNWSAGRESCDASALPAPLMWSRWKGELLVKLAGMEGQTTSTQVIRTDTVLNLPTGR